MFDQESPMVDQTIHMIDQKSPVIDHKSPVIDQKSPVIDQMSPIKRALSKDPCTELLFVFDGAATAEPYTGLREREIVESFKGRRAWSG